MKQHAKMGKEVEERQEIIDNSQDGKTFVY